MAQQQTLSAPDSAAEEGKMGGVFRCARSKVHRSVHIHYLVQLCFFVSNFVSLKEVNVCYLFLEHL